MPLLNPQSVLRLSILFCAAFLAGNTPGRCDQENNGVVAGGVVFNIASDRQVKNIGGIVQPEPLDLYLKRLIDGMTERLERLEKKMDGVASDVKSLKGRGGSAPASAASIVR